MGLTFSVSGVLQAYIERVLGLGFMTAQAQMRFWFAITRVLAQLPTWAAMDPVVSWGYPVIQ
jgi:hypothetical protein